MSLPFSCYFCQKLYFHLDSSERTDIIVICFSNLDELLRSNHSVLAFVSIIESEIPVSEQILIIRFMEEQFIQRANNNKFLRLLESIVNCFSHEIMLPLLAAVSRNFSKLIILKQGYYLIRALIRSSKNPTIQLAIANSISDQFISIANSLSGSLLIQCIIHNFLRAEFTYEKCCTSNSWTNQDQLVLHRKYEISSMSNYPLHLILCYLFENIIYWDNNSIVPIVLCAIKNSQRNFHDCLVYYLASKVFLRRLVNLGSINNYISSLREFYSPALMLQLHQQFLQVEYRYFNDAEALQYLLYLANLLSFKLRHMGILSLSNIATKPTYQKGIISQNNCNQGR